MLHTKLLVLLILVISFNIYSQFNPGIQKLAKDFFKWRANTQPSTGDDILRVGRPDKWVPDYSSAAINNNQEKYLEYSYKLENLPRENWTLTDSVDYLLLHSAIERVNWELNVLKLPERNPDFYVHQTIGAVFELLLIHTPMTRERAENIILRLNSIPKTIEHAIHNLTEPVAPFAEIALHNLSNVDSNLYAMRDALNEIFPVDLNAQLNSAVEHAKMALEKYVKWIEENKSSMQSSFIIGREGYEYFLKNIALMPYTTDELLIMGKQEWDRSVSFDVYERERNKGLPELPIFSSAKEEIEVERRDEESIRNFLVEKEILSIPDWVKHYVFQKIPPHFEPFAHMGVNDDLTSETRLDEDGVRYIREPSPDLGYFSLATAKDPRPIIIHEGVPGHYFQMVLSWANPNPIRRRYFDSGANEGIAFYVEELLLQYGLFDDKPKTREIIYSFMRLRALRVDVDINLALGNYTIEDAGKYLASTVPMDLPTGIKEAGFFAYNPGQAITYQIGKLQILKFIADAKVMLGDDFDLRDFHDYIMENGNVPIALLRWEYLGLNDEIQQLWPE
ncbi:MAG: DUF885 domain-containing protein [Ignavibacterium sp.]|nr:MAG: DUF885 domain-containing protein [Ignavibacterium sp.]